MKDALLRFIRKLPRSTAQCRAAFKLAASIDVERALEGLRDEGEIAFANGAWYVLDTVLHVKPSGSAPVHPKQIPLFADADGRRLTGHEQLVERIQEKVRRVRG